MRFAISTVAWCGAVLWFWQNCVPLPPTAVIRPYRAVWHVGYSRDGQIVFCGRAERDDGSLGMTGPLHFWDPSTGDLDRGFLNDREWILGLSLEQGGVAVVRRDDRLRAVELRTGRTLFERAAAPDFEQVNFTPDERHVSIGDGAGFTIYNLQTGKQQWSKSDAILDRFDGSQRVIASPRRNGRRIGEPKLVLDIATGAPELAAAAGPAGMITHHAENGRFSLVVFGRGDVRLSDVATGQPLWKLPPEIQTYYFQFSADGDELLVPHRTPQGVRFARWNAADGRVIVPLPPLAQPHPQAFESEDGRYAVSSEERSLMTLPGSFVRLLNACGISWTGRLAAEGKRIYVTDLRSNQQYTIGLSDPNPLMSPRGDGFAVLTDAGVACYELPPRRDWWSLAAGCLIPPIGLRVMSGRWQALRRLLQTSMPTFFPGARQPALR